MNWIIRIGMWWESRRKVAYVDFKKAVEELRATQRDPDVVTKELKLMNIRLNQLELYVGLKREQKPVEVPGQPRIQ